MDTVEIKDALAEKDVLVTVLVKTQPGMRDKRPCLVSVGIQDAQVVMRAGTFGELAQLIDHAWAEYAEVVMPTAEPELGVIADVPVDEDMFAYSDDDF